MGAAVSRGSFADLSQTRAVARTVGPRVEILALLVIFVAGTFLRFATISDHSIWIDEAYTYAVTQLPTRHLMFVSFDTHPALYFIVQQILPAEAGNESSLRLMAALASLIPIYILARWLLGNVGALTVTALNATAYTNLVFANDARNYPLLTLFSVLLLAALYRLSKDLLVGARAKGKRNYAWIAVYALSAIGALYTHHIAVLFIAAANFAVFLIFSPTVKSAVSNALRLIAVNVPVLIVWAPLALQVQAASEGISWLEQTGPVNAVWSVAAVILPDQTGLLLLVGYAFAILAGVLITVRRRAAEMYLTASLVVLFPLMVWVIGYILQPLFMPRTILPVLLGATLLVGAVAAYARSNVFAVIATSVAVFASVFSGIQYLRRDLTLPFVDNGQPTQDWRAAAHGTMENEGAVIVLCSPYWLPTVTFYEPGAPVYVAQSNGEYWPVTEDQWRDFYGLPQVERNVGREALLRTMLASQGAVPADAEGLAAAYRHVAFLEVALFQIKDCSSRVLAEFEALTGVVPAEHAYTGVRAWDLSVRP